MTGELPSLGAALAAARITPRKSLGQNFLLDASLLRRIARAAAEPLAQIKEAAKPLAQTKSASAPAKKTILEIGAGPGGLTRALLDEGAARVIAIEKDTRFLGLLEELQAHYPRRLQIQTGDALEILREQTLPRAFDVVANLPYQIAAPLLLEWFGGDAWPPRWGSLTLLLQKEFAERLAAQPNTSAYGRLSVLCQWRARVRLCFGVKAAAFTPAPKVDSAVVRLEARAKPTPAPFATLMQLTRAAFGQRRKMLRGALRGLTPAPELILQKAGIQPTQRAQELSVAQFCALAAVLEKSA